MAIFNDTYPASGRRGTYDSGVSGSSLRGGLRRLVSRWTAWRDRDRELQELHRFSDRELWDVGLSRSDIMSIESGTYRRD